MPVTPPPPNQVPILFSDRARHARRLRALRRGVLPHHFLLDWVVEEMAERLAFVNRRFARVLLIGPVALHAARFAPPDADVSALIIDPAEAGGLPHFLGDDGTIPADLNGFDLIISALTLDSVNDLPGALVQIRRALAPDGLFLGAMFGAGSLPQLRRMMMAADGDRVRAHLHPQIDVRSAGDLLRRVGFALPVADATTLDVRYRALSRLIDDLRDLGVGNALRDAGCPGGRGYWRALDAAFTDARDGDGRVTERFDVLHLSGWAPAPGQPQPARRGSALASLASALGDRSK